VRPALCAANLPPRYCLGIFALLFWGLGSILNLTARDIDHEFGELAGSRGRLAVIGCRYSFYALFDTFGRALLQSLWQPPMRPYRPIRRFRNDRPVVAMISRALSKSAGKSCNSISLNMRPESPLCQPPVCLNQRSPLPNPRKRSDTRKMEFVSDICGRDTVPDRC